MTRANADMRFYTNGHTNERMRIDSSGNLLVNTTASQSGIAKAAVQFDSGSQYGLEIKDAGAGTTGTFSIFYRGSTVVGSIGTNGGNPYFSSGSVGLKLTTEVLPVDNNGASADGFLDLGGASDRFNNLYLSGGVYLGGTGSANKLDDYESGTFTTTLIPGSGSITLSTTNDLVSYTKIGNQVFVTGRIIITSVSSPSGSEFYITSLPYTIKTPSEGETGGAGSITYYDSSISTYLSTQVANVDGNTAGQSNRWRVFKDCSTMGANDQISFTFNYTTT